MIEMHNIYIPSRGYVFQKMTAGIKIKGEEKREKGKGEEKKGTKKGKGEERKDAKKGKGGRKKGKREEKRGKK